VYLRKVDGLELVAGYVGLVALAVGAWELLPLALLPFFPNEIPYATSFVIAGASAIILGYLGYSGIRYNAKAKLTNHLDMASVLCSIAFSSIFFALPFIAIEKFTVTEALFEAVGGLTATGITLLDTDSSPRIIVAYRSLLQLFGSGGFLALLAFSRSATFAVPSGGAPGRGEGRLGLDGKEALKIFAVLGVYILLGFLAYGSAGTGWFDAFILSVSAVTTGGFSSRSGNIGAFGSLPVELITMALMILGSVSILFHARIARGLKSRIVPHCEIRSSLFSLAIFFIPSLLVLVVSVDGTLAANARISIFHLVSALSATGFQTINPKAMPPLFFLMLIFSMLIGGSAMSLAGGIKQARVAILFQDFKRHLRIRSSERRILGAARVAYMGECRELGDSDVGEARRFALLYLLCFALGTAALSATGASLQDSAFEFASILGNNGFSSGIMVKGASEFTLWSGTIGMILGRLEIYFVILAIFSLSPRFGKRARIERPS
jgi:trk system potassium uptake protein TrkH